MSIIEQIKQRFNNNQLETEKLKLQLSNIKSTLVSIKVVKQICDIDLDQLELISEYVTKAKVDLPTGIIDWRSYLDTVSINMYKERKQLMGSVDDEWMIWLYNKSERIGDFIKPDSIEEHDNTYGRKKPDTDEITMEEKTKKATTNELKVTKNEALALCEKLLSPSYKMSNEEKEIEKTNNFKSARTSFMKQKKMYENFPSILNELEKQMFISSEKMTNILNAPSNYYRPVLILSFLQSCNRKGRFDDKYYKKVGGKSLSIKDGKQGKEIGYKLIPKV